MLKWILIKGKLNLGFSRISRTYEIYLFLLNSFNNRTIDNWNAYLFLGILFL